VDFIKNKTAIFFSPHPDDEVISAGALLFHLAKTNDVQIYYLTNSPKGVGEDISEKQKIQLRQREAKKVCDVLGASANFLNLDKPELEVNKNNTDLLKNIILKLKPGLIITLHPGEAHPTHQKTAYLVKKATKNLKIPKFFGETWSPITKPTDMFFFEEEMMKIKSRAFNQYQSQLKRTNWIEATQALNRFRAITAREVLGEFGSKFESVTKFAEAFLVEK
jgi:LmbE family N-acetylglucosaminyl deacetylase